MINQKQLMCAAGLLALSTGIAAAATARVETDLNVRAGQGTQYPVVGVMPAGQVVEVSGCGDGWCYVHDYGGYASASYLGGSVVSYGTTYVAPPAVYVAPAPVYRGRTYWNDSRRVVRPAVRAFRQELRQDRREDRREVRQDRRENRRDARQEVRQERRQEVRQGPRQEMRQDRREARQDRRADRRDR